MELERNSKCWYKEVCQLDDCTNCLRFNEMSYLVNNSGIPKNRQYPDSLIAGEDLESFMVLDNFKSYIEEYVKYGSCLYITSKRTGNGKTSWAIKILLKYFDCIWAGNGFRVRGMFVHVPTFLNQLKNFNSPLSEEYKSNILNADLVVWDDIASTKLSEYDHSQLLSYIDQRLFNGLSNIYTGNVPKFDDLVASVGERLASRIWCSKIVELVGADRRIG